MAAHPINLVETDIRTVLATITTGNGYKTTIGSHIFLPDPPEQVVNLAHPVVGATMLDGVVEMQAARRIRENTEFVISVCVIGAGTTETQLRTSTALQLGNLYDDIKTALMLDITRGGNAFWTKLTATRRAYRLEPRLGFMEILGMVRTRVLHTAT